MKLRPWPTTRASSRPFWCALALTLAVPSRSPAASYPFDVATSNGDADQAVPLKRGQPAPFAGQLLSTELAITLGQAAAGCEDRIRLEVGRVNADWQVELEQEQSECKTQSEAFSAQLKLAVDSAARAQKVAAESQPPFFLQPWFVGPVAALLGAGAVIWIVHH